MKFQWLAISLLLGIGYLTAAGLTSGTTIKAETYTTPTPTRCPDSDGDYWTDCAENIIDTDPLAKCPTSPTHNAWPPDTNNDGFDDISDIVALAASFGQAVPPAPARHDIAPDDPDGFVDISDIVSMGARFGRSCS